MAQWAVQRPTWIARMRAKLLTSLGKSSRSSRKFAMDIPQHGCGTRPIIICAALRLRRDELHRRWDHSFMVQIRLTDSLALTRSPPVKPVLAAFFVDQPPRRNRPGAGNRGLRQNKPRFSALGVSALCERHALARSFRRYLCYARRPRLPALLCSLGRGAN